MGDHAPLNGTCCGPVKSHMPRRGRSAMSPAKASEPEPESTPLDKFVEQVALRPHVLVAQDAELADSVCLPALKELFDTAKQCEPKQFGVLPTLLLEGFDVDQIWHQIHLRNKPLVRYLKKCAKRLASEMDEISLCPEPVQSKKSKAQSEDEDSDSDAEVSGEEEEPAAAPKKKKPRRAGGLEDGFFDMDEMEEFLEEQERAPEPGEEPDSDEEDSDEVDYFEDVGSEEDEHDDEKGARYGDFFDPPEEDAQEEGEDDGEDEEEEEEELMLKQLLKGKDKDLSRGNNPFAAADDSDEDGDFEGEDDFSGGEEQEPMAEGEEDEEEDEEDEAEDEEEDEEDADTGPQTAFEKQQSRIKEQIDKLEEEAIAEKSWLLKGEASRHDRSKDSLLAPDLEVEHTAKAAPEGTQERMESIEELIKQRIRDELWNDVVRREETVGGDNMTTSMPEVSKEKSKAGLGEIYEQEYREQVMGEVKEDEMDKEELEIQEMWTRLCYSLDSLTNFHYTPKPPTAEMETRTNVASVAMEEAIPMAISDAMQLAPEELFKQKQHTSNFHHKGEDELTPAERKSRRNAKKKRGAKSRIAQGAGRKHRLELDKAGENQLNVVTAAPGGGKSLSSSKKFFKDLKDNANKPAVKKAKKKTDKPASHFKM